MYKIALIINIFFINFLYANDGLISPIPLKIDVDEKKVALGKALFFETRLSKDNTISCASCHNLKEGGDDNLRVSFGVGGKQGTRNAPTVYNAVFNFRQFWDGRAKDLADQAMGPIENPVEMAHSFQEIVPLLKKSQYKKQFNKIYSDGVTKKNIADAIAEYEKTLITPNAPFDRYLRGDIKALSKNTEDGYAIFKTKGCILCHQGINVGGNMYNKFGVFEEQKLTDLGRYNVTHKENPASLKVTNGLCRIVKSVGNTRHFITPFYRLTHICFSLSKTLNTLLKGFKWGDTSCDITIKEKEKNH